MIRGQGGGQEPARRVPKAQEKGFRFCSQCSRGRVKGCVRHDLYF